MKQLFHVKTLPILITIQARERIECVTFSEHLEGLACTVSSQASPALITEIMQFIEGYIEGKSSPLPLLDWRGQTPFTQTVLLKLATLPFGTTQTYKQIGIAVDSPQGARAIGGACGRNPFPFFLPCHRVVASNGLGGFSAGLNFKKIMLDFEKNQK